MQTGFHPRRAIVTGSDSGIGAATALALADAGLDVVVTWHSDQDGAEQTARGVRDRGRRAFVRHFDATDLDQVGASIDSMVDELGGLDVFVNNSGGGNGGPVLDVDVDTWRAIVSLRRLSSATSAPVLEIFSYLCSEPPMHAQSPLCGDNGDPACKRRGRETQRR